ncbi:IclR family transcriptional regulator domain-containing protein [Thermaurantiacus sp.]
MADRNSAPGDGEPERDGHVRALARGLQVLKVINRGGSVTMMQISRGAGIPYPTAVRIVDTLIAEGMVEREPARKRYRPTALVRALASGYREADDLVAAARPIIVELTRRFLWPVSISTRVGGMMMVQDSTHQLTTLTFHNYAPGFTLPLSECASGKVWLAFADPDDLETVKAGLAHGDGPAERMARLLLAGDNFLQRIRARGYATQARNAYTATPGKTSSLAAPLFRRGKVAGAMSLIFFSAAMSMREAEARYAAALLDAANRLSTELDSLPGG